MTEPEEVTRYRCPDCGAVYETYGECIDHIFGMHQSVMDSPLLGKCAAYATRRGARHIFRIEKVDKDGLLSGHGLSLDGWDPDYGFEWVYQYSESVIGIYDRDEAIRIWDRWTKDAVSEYTAHLRMLMDKLVGEGEQ